MDSSPLSCLRKQKSETNGNVPAIQLLRTTSSPNSGRTHRVADDYEKRRQTPRLRTKGNASFADTAGMGIAPHTLTPTLPRGKGWVGDSSSLLWLVKRTFCYKDSTCNVQGIVPPTRTIERISQSAPFVKYALHWYIPDKPRCGGGYSSVKISKPRVPAPRQVYPAQAQETPAWAGVSCAVRPRCSHGSLVRACALERTHGCTTNHLRQRQNALQCELQAH